jgi:hypothetical protein
MDKNKILCFDVIFQSSLMHCLAERHLKGHKKIFTFNLRHIYNENLRRQFDLDKDSFDSTLFDHQAYLSSCLQIYATEAGIKAFAERTFPQGCQQCRRRQYHLQDDLGNYWPVLRVLQAAMKIVCAKRFRFGSTLKSSRQGLRTFSGNKAATCLHGAYSMAKVGTKCSKAVANPLVLSPRCF